MNYTGTNQGKYAFHFVADKLRDGRPIPKDGEWLEHIGPTSICHYGLHASWRVFDALKYSPGATLCLVEVAGIAEQQDDKLVCGSRKIIARFDATQLLRDDARASARSCLKNWPGGAVPRIILDWLNTGDEGLRSAAGSAAESAAWSAAGSAARSAAESAWYEAWYAAWYAAESAAGSAAESARSAAESEAMSAASERLHNAVMAKFIEMGVLS